MSDRCRWKRPPHDDVSVSFCSRRITGLGLARILLHAWLSSKGKAELESGGTLSLVCQAQWAKPYLVCEAHSGSLYLDVVLDWPIKAVQHSKLVTISGYDASLFSQPRFEHITWTQDRVFLRKPFGENPHWGHLHWRFSACLISWNHSHTHHQSASSSMKCTFYHLSFSGLAALKKINGHTN